MPRQRAMLLWEAMVSFEWHLRVLHWALATVVWKNVKNFWSIWQLSRVASGWHQFEVCLASLFFGNNSAHKTPTALIHPAMCSWLLSGPKYMLCLAVGVVWKISISGMASDLGVVNETTWLWSNRENDSNLLWIHIVLANLSWMNVKISEIIFLPLWISFYPGRICRDRCSKS